MNWGPFRHRNYVALWIATVAANVGTWMYAAAAGWLMTTLTTDALMVSMVQVATTLPMFLFALPAGALADILDARRLLIVIEAGIIVVAATFALLVGFERVTPVSLLVFTFLIEAGAAMAAPAWQSIVPRLVPRADLPGAITANSVGVNISRAIGPALGGVLTAAVGMAAPFWANAFSNVGSIGVLAWWRPQRKDAHALPAERLASAMRTGIRYVAHNRPLRSTLFRAVSFFFVASAYWALLPLVVHTQMAGSSQLYGVLLGAIGVGAIAGAFAMSPLRKRLGPDRLVALGHAGTAAALVLYAVAHEPATALAASLLAGACWISGVSSLNVSTQVALPEWVRARGLAVHVAVSFGAMTLGSAIWGQVANVGGLPMAHLAAAAGALLAIPLTWRWKLQEGASLDLSPSMHWPEPITVEKPEGDAGPVMVSVEYRIAAANRERFVAAYQAVARQRRRDGAYACGLFEDAAEPGRFVETFYLESWVEHLRQHDRVTHADRELEERLHALVEGTPKVTHFIAAR